ncbi:MAG: hypothetical protein KA956_10700 [Pyrinomonadaceae bacterium]|nr:hypothetical protein [Acidobacteriota bacterium]MBK7931931.1 hypothetical protein [Acidobacteriota bacterium]MBP7376932.1 hypothetical protein [Pyrinomonadaceae bacterium]
MEAIAHYRFTFVVTTIQFRLAACGPAGKGLKGNLHPMFTAKSVNFCKNEDCPSSDELLDFQNGDLMRERAVDIRIHMASCEFCTAEAEFYSRYPQLTGDDLSTEPSEIPAPLFELAEALLKNRSYDPRALNTLLRETEELVGDAA